MVTFTQAHREFIEKYFEDEVLDLPYDAQELLDCEDASQVLEALSDMDEAISYLAGEGCGYGPEQLDAISRELLRVRREFKELNGIPAL